jgi:hypothetical protein
LSPQELFRRRSPVESPEQRLHRIDNRIAEGVIVFLRFSDLIFPAGPIDADGGVIGRHEWYLQ